MVNVPPTVAFPVTLNAPPTVAPLVTDKESAVKVLEKLPVVPDILPLDVKEVTVAAPNEDVVAVNVPPVTEQ